MSKKFPKKFPKKCSHSEKETKDFNNSKMDGLRGTWTRCKRCQKLLDIQLKPRPRK